MLPAPGQILVRSGDRVEPVQLVGRTELPGEFHILPAARMLGVRSARLSKLMRVEIGEDVQVGQTIASRRGLAGRAVKSPIDGILAAAGRGRILVEARPQEHELRAYIRGTVTDVIAQDGVVIETTGALIQGVWGTGGEAFGVLKCIARRRDDPMRARLIDPSCHGTILVGGSRLDETVLEQAQEMQIRGIVTGGLPYEVLPLVEDLPFPIVVTDGLGEVPMAEPIFRLLSTNEGREASISGAVRSRWGVTRPEVVIPLPAETLPAEQVPPGSPLVVGQRVRVVAGPRISAVGTVVRIPPHARYIDTGARVRGAELDLGEEEPVFVPLMNLEILR
jgi:hypothetical protein